MYTLSNESFEKLTNKVSFFNKKLEKRGLSPIVITDVEDIFVKEGKEYTHKKNFNISGDYPKIEGYEFVAKIDHKENMILSENNIEELEKFRHVSYCHHCGTHRKRNVTFVLRNQETNELVQIGSKCIVDYIGKSAESMVFYASCMSSIINFSDEEAINGGSRTPYYDIYEIIDIAYKLISDFGFVSVKNSYEGSTTKMIFDFMNVQNQQYVFPDGYNFEITKNVHNDVFEYIKKEDEKGYNQFVKNCLELCNGRYITYKYFSFVAAMVNMWNRSKTETKQENYEFIPVGEKIKEKAVKFVNRVSFETIYGMKHILTFKDEENHLFVWFTTTSPFGLEEGKEMVIKSATVKENKEYKGKKQTVITRVRFN